MAYLLSFGWLAGALPLGAFLGFLGFSRTRDGTSAGSWIALLGLAALAIGFSPSVADFFSGRDAAALDPALLAGSAYAAGLPLGGMLLPALGPRVDARPVAPPVLLLGAPAAPVMAVEPEFIEVAEPLRVTAFEPVEELVLAPAPADAVERTDPPSMETLLAALEPAPVLEAVAAAPEPAPASPLPEKRPTPGVRPETLPAPRAGVADDLVRIKGVGPKSLEKLNALGVFHYDQIAAWTLDNARWIGATIGAPGRVQRDKWIEQAQALAGAGTDV